MAIPIQVVFDCADPPVLAKFWADALGYQLQGPPEPTAMWQNWAVEHGIPEEQWNDASAIIDPDSNGPRIYFQRVPEPKAVKNRLHLDVNAGGPRGRSADGCGSGAVRCDPSSHSRLLEGGSEGVTWAGAEAAAGDRAGRSGAAT
jgi:hypothetical protein